MSVARYTRSLIESPGCEASSVTSSAGQLLYHRGAAQSGLSLDRSKTRRIEAGVTAPAVRARVRTSLTYRDICRVSPQSAVFSASNAASERSLISFMLLLSLESFFC